MYRVSLTLYCLYINFETPCVSIHCESTYIVNRVSCHQKQQIFFCPLTLEHPVYSYELLQHTGINFLSLSRSLTFDQNLLSVHRLYLELNMLLTFYYALYNLLLSGWISENTFDSRDKSEPEAEVIEIGYIIMVATGTGARLSRPK